MGPEMVCPGADHSSCKGRQTQVHDKVLARYYVTIADVIGLRWCDEGVPVVNGVGNGVAWSRPQLLQG
jgi:hypothetical protein